MKRLRLHSQIALVLFLAVSCTNPETSDSASYLLFEENVNDWYKMGDASWSFVNNELIGRLDSGSGFVITQKAYKDFELTVEFKPDSTINSGVFVRCVRKEISATECYEINIWDLHPNQDYRTGAIVTRSEPLAQVETLNKWNTYKINVNGNRIQAYVNGVLTADLTDDGLVEGYIALQAAGTGEIRFRNVMVKQLNSDPARGGR